eukprot:5801335-Alexandrium_andersonii.AAC.1
MLEGAIRSLTALTIVPIGANSADGLSTALCLLAARARGPQPTARGRSTTSLAGTDHSGGRLRDARE